jgi:hypothetical protein
MPCSLSEGPDHSAASNGSQLVLEPPAVLPLTEGGGPELFISFEQIWTVHEKALRSTVHNGFRTPPAVLPLTEGGGGSGIVYKLRADLDGSKSGAQINGPQWIPDPPPPFYL